MEVYRIAHEGIELTVEICMRTKNNKTLLNIYSANGYYLDTKLYTEKELKELLDCRIDK